MTRIQTLDYSALSDAQKSVHDAISSGPRGVVQGPLKVWLESPELADKAQALGAFCRYDTSLPARLSELAIIVTGAFWEAGFEWHIHAPIAISEGIHEDIVQAIYIHDEPVFTRKDERVVYEFARELLSTRAISDDTFATAKETLSYRGVVDLIGVLGYYGLISMTIKAFNVPLPEGAAVPFA